MLEVRRNDRMMDLGLDWSNLDMPKVIGVHSVRDIWEEKLRGRTGMGIDTRYYGDRVLTLEDLSVAFLEDLGEEGGAEEIESYCSEYLPGIIGRPIDVTLVPVEEGVTFYNAIRQNEGIFSRIREEIERGGALQAFSSSREHDTFVAEMSHGIETSCASVSPKFDIANRLDNKVLARVLATLLDKQHGTRVVDTYPVFRICWSEEEVRSHAGELLREYGRVIVKSPDLASGVGMIDMRVGDSYRKLNQLLKERFDPSQGMVVEQHLGRHLPVSVQWRLHNGEATCRFFSAQTIVNGTKYDGGDIGSFPVDALDSRIETWLRPTIVEQVFALGEAELAWALAEKYEGCLGMDAMIPIEEQNGRLKITGPAKKSEFSARVTAMTFADGLRRQLCRAGKFPAVATRNCEPTCGVDGWRAAVDLLGDLNYSRETGEGVVVMLTRRLPEKCVLYGVHPRSMHKARELVDRARERLGHKQDAKE